MVCARVRLSLSLSLSLSLCVCVFVCMHVFEVDKLCETVFVHSHQSKARI